MTLRDLSQRKFAYTNKGVSHLPYVEFHLASGTTTTSKLPFLVDSGSIYSYAPEHYSIGLGFDIDWAKELRNNCEDLSGNALGGVPIMVKLMLAADPTIAIEEVIYFRRQLSYAVLGHETFLKTYPALFYGKERSLTLFNLRRASLPG